MPEAHEQSAHHEAEGVHVSAHRLAGAVRCAKHAVEAVLVARSARTMDAASARTPAPANYQRRRLRDTELVPTPTAPAFVRVWGMTQVRGSHVGVCRGERHAPEYPVEPVTVVDSTLRSEVERSGGFAWVERVRVVRYAVSAEPDGFARAVSDGDVGARIATGDERSHRGQGSDTLSPPDHTRHCGRSRSD